MIPRTRLAYTDAWRIRCDVCHLDYYVFGTRDNDPEEIRRVASKSGWHHRDGKDVCPHCIRVPAVVG